MREIATDQRDRCNHVSVDVENQLELVNSVREKLGWLVPCLPTVAAPMQLRQAAEKSFMPEGYINLAAFTTTEKIYIKHGRAQIALT